ncbi:Tex family protein [Prevotella histicola]
MIRQTPYSKENEYKNNSEHSANRALPLSGEPEGAPVTSFISHSLSLPLQSVSAVLTLLNEGCTIPFISRYRKERTGGLDEVQITDISELYDRLKELNKRKETILKTIREQEKLTPELEARIRACMDSTELEDIYLPYKPKRRTRAQIAREQGLEPLALAIMEEASPNPSERRGEAPPDLPEPTVTDRREVMGGGVPMRTRENKGTLNLPQHLSKIFANLSPLPSEGSGEALALDIIAEIVSENQQARNTVRTAYQRGAVITSKVIKKMKDTEEAQKFADYFDFSEPLRRCNSHRLLAMRRGEAQGILRVSITIDGEECIARLTRQFVRGQGVCQTLVSQAVEDSFKRLINPSIENEFAALSKERADEEAIKVFTENLRQLLLSPPLGQKRVLALDPGFANGCKIACLDEQGNLLHHEIIYPHPPRNQVRQATEALQRMIRTYKIEAIAIGNGTASRESKEFVEKTSSPSPSPLPQREGSDYCHLPKSKQQFTDNASPNFAKQTDNYHNPNSKPQSTGHFTPLPLGEGSGEGPVGPVASASSLFIFLVSEDGASIYSASPVAREEFPNEDVTTRGAISIGRRLMDPLAELVKIDPKSIGVGQYQHDVDQSKLKHSLDQTVMSCVNQVGVNLNTASLHLLTYVSGLGPALARNIIDYRREHGPFTSRAQLKKVKRLGDTAFQQCAGFLRIPNAKNPLDNSAVHPESYHIVEQMAKDLKCTIKDLIGNKKLLAEIDVKRYLTPQPPLRRERGSAGNGSLKDGDKLKKSLPSCERIGTPLLSEGLGEVSLRDILTELEKPGRDPRGEVEVFEFDKNVHTLSDLIIGMELPGIVTNITNFGAFVDIGVHQDGLVHISQLSDRFVTDPTQVVRLHQHVRVRVVEVDMRRKRIALSMKNIKQ